MKEYKIFRVLLFLIISILLPACGGVLQKATPIQMLKEHPEKYQEPASVKIKARVLATTDIFGISACKVDDGTSTIYVISPRGYREGDEIIVKGHIENVLGKSNWKFVVFYEDEPARE